MPLDCATADERLTQVRRRIAHFEGRREALLARQGELTRAIGLAKARLSLKPKVDAFLQSLQNEAHERTIGSYERMLTAVVQDVLPQPGLSIRLRLHTVRGLPHLDIEAVKDGQAVDILEGCGGSVTNVISLGLRTIATVKSGARPFLALDEPDCWIKPDRVRGFYGVVKRMASSMGFQALVISHHDVGLFDAGINVISVTGTPSEGLTVSARAGAAAWPDEETPGIRSIRLKGVASYADATLKLAPGVNAVIGDNNIGKSQGMRFLRAAAYGGNEATDGIVRHGEKRAEGWIALERGRVLNYSREPRRNPVNLWRLTEADGSVAVIDGARCEEGGRDAPEWVAKALGVARMDGLDLQLAHQKFPVFLLGEPGSRRASVLSLGQESAHLRDMIQAHKDTCSSDSVTVKTGEAELATLIRAIDGMAGAVGAAQDAEAAATYMATVRKADGTANRARTAAARLDGAARGLALTEARLAALEGLSEVPAVEALIARARGAGIAAARVWGAASSLARAEAQLGALATLPEAAPTLAPCDPPAEAARWIHTSAQALAECDRMAAALAALPDEPPTVSPTGGASMAARRVAVTGEGLVRAEAQLAALAALPDEPPALPSTGRASELAARVSRAAEGLASVQAELTRVETDEAAAAAEVDEAMLETGGACPLCGSGLAHAHNMTRETA